MMHVTPRQALRGFSLVEIMVSMTIGLVLLAGLVAVFSGSKQSARVHSSMATLQEGARFALDAMERDVRMAGFHGCLSSIQSPYTTQPVVNTIADPDVYENDFNLPLQGYSATASGWVPTLDPLIEALHPEPSSTGDVITVRIPVGESYPVSAVMASGSAAVPVVMPAVAPVDLQPPAAVIVSDCYAAAAFRVTAVVAGELEHAATANATTDLGHAFGPDAMVSRAQAITYYVGASSYAPTDTETSLWRVAGTSAPEELVDGVEALRILYGEDVSTPPDFVADWFVRADQIHAEDMSGVVSVTIELLMRSLESRVTLSAEGPATYFDGTRQSAPADRRLRRSYRSTVMLRNRAP
jgi:type IV pilus assembly protein PilW